MNKRSLSSNKGTLFFNKGTLLANKRLLYPSGHKTTGSVFIPKVGMFYSQAGNILFPSWEYRLHNQGEESADVLFKTTFLENWGSGVGRMVDACKQANLSEPEFNQNAAFVWVTFKRATIQPYNHTSSPLRSTDGRLQGKNPTTPQVNTPSTPSTSKRKIAKARRLKALLSAIGTNGSNLRALMESMQRKDRKGFVSTYIVPNIEAGYIAMLYPEAPNHPMQSYYLTKKGRELLEQL